MTEPRGTSAPLPASPLEPWPDTVTWHRVSHRLIYVGLLSLLAGLAAAAAVIAVAALLGWQWVWQAFAVLALFGLVRGITLVRAVRAWGYAERERELLVRHGLLVRRLSIVPYARMQFVDVTAGPLERAFGLATVKLHTAAAGTDAEVPGLAPAEAARLRDRLTALGENLGEGL